MADLAIITPSRGRPRQFADMAASVFATAGSTVQVWSGLDYDDTSDYLAPLAGIDGDLVIGVRGERLSLSGWTNLLADRALSQADPPRYLASLGDDHRPRTRGWDLKLINAIEAMGGSGIAYGNDLLQGRVLPTAWVMSADIVRSLGWMMLPVCQHMCVDDAILRLGQELGLIAYRPDVVIEHLHPAAGKAAMDESYRASNRPDQMSADRRAFDEWCSAGGLAHSVEQVRADLALARAR